MAASRVGRSLLYQRHPPGILDIEPLSFAPANFRFSLLRQHLQRRTFTCSRCVRQEQKRKEEEPFRKRLGAAWRNTKIEWKPIPIGVGIGLLGLLQFFRVRAREREKGEIPEGSRPPKRERIRPSGGWQVQVMSTLPLKALSRVWGRFNELTIPYYLRVPGFKLYGWIFGVNFSEVGEEDLHAYPNLASFFYRSLKPGVRPLDPNPRAILSPADGRVLQFGTIEHGEVEQVKGVTYSLDALMGGKAPSTSTNPAAPSNMFQQPQSLPSDDPDAVAISADQEFARMNGISYTLPNLFSGHDSQLQHPEVQDQSIAPRPSSEAEVRADLATTQPWWSPFDSQTTAPQKLFYVVVYLAPGDYHRFHSPVSWVCTSRRHFAGELYSVSPYLQRTLPGLFTLNERVVLLGRWKYGFFSYTPVGATNVGSIKINFDRELRTNSLTTDTAADRAAAEAAERGEPYSGFSEATYEKASKVLGGYALRRGEEMGGFALGSSIVIVFQAPAGEIDPETSETKGGFRWNVEKGQKVKVGQALGWVQEDE